MGNLRNPNLGRSFFRNIGAYNIFLHVYKKNGATAEYSPHSLDLLKDYPNPNHYPDTNIRKQDLKSSLAAVW